MKKKQLSPPELQRVLRDVAHELNARILLVAGSEGQVLLYEGMETPKTMDLLAALSAAGMSALQEIILAAFRSARRDADNLLILEVPQGVILISSQPPYLFMAVISDKTRLGLARMLLRRLSQEYDWSQILIQEEAGPSPFASRSHPQAEGQGEDLFAELWSN